MNINKKVCKYCNNIKDFFKTKFKCVDCYIKINKETKIKSRNKLYVKALLNSCYNSDKKKDREFDISEDFIKNIINNQNNKCNYCNKKLSNNMEILTPNRISIDRINSKIGHIKSNVAISCYFCNMIKNNLENKDLYLFLDLLSNKCCINIKYYDKFYYKKWKSCLIKNTNNNNRRISKENKDININWITLQYIKQCGLCYYSKLPLIPTTIPNFILQPSIERKDCSIGYIKSNCVLVCRAINSARNNIEINIFLNYIKQFSFNQKFYTKYNNYFYKYSKLPGWIVYKNYCGWCFCYNTNNGKKTIIHKSFNDKELGSSKALVSSIIENVLFNFEKLIK